MCWYQKKTFVLYLGQQKQTKHIIILCTTSTEPLVILFLESQYCGLLSNCRHATPEEAQLLWDALAKKGKRWNPETMQVEPIKKERWRADYGCVYFYFNYDFVVSTTKEYKFNTDDICYNSGNYFRTKAQAQRAADRLKAELDKFGEEELRF